MSGKHIRVDYLARVEGEAALDVRVRDGSITSLQLNVFEPPRFFQGFLVGRKYDEVPGIVSRICGICPVSHQLTSIMAIEDAMGVKVSRQTRDLRKLFALSQYIQSHALHIYLLAAPDFLGYESVLSMVPDHLQVVARALKLKRLGNDLTTLIGGREVHPVTAVVGGFTAIPSRADLLSIRERLVKAKADGLATIELIASLSLPDFQWDTEHVALTADGEYAVNAGRLLSNKGLDIPVWEYRGHIKEKHVPHSHALHSYIEGRGSFLVGPLARVNLNMARMMPEARQAAMDSGVFPSLNPFHSALARAVELVHSIEESILLIDRLEPVEEERDYVIQAGEGFAITEAPRGILYHSYRINDQGVVEAADIVSPTAHNVHNMEQDLWRFVPTVLDLPEEEATLKCEMVIRNYDPCFSCSAHFLKMKVDRG